MMMGVVAKLSGWNRGVVVVSVDLIGLENLAEKLVAITNDSEDLLGRFGQLKNELICDEQLPALPQSQELMQIMMNVLKNLQITTDSMNSIQQIVKKLPDEYGEIEEKGRRTMEQMTVRANVVNKRLQRKLAKISVR